MKKNLATLVVLLFVLKAHAQQTIGLLLNGPGNQDGYVLFAPNSSDTTYLIDKCGYRVHQWPSTHPPGQSVYLLEDGSLLRTARANNAIFNAGGQGGIIERIDWNGNIVWTYTLSNTVQCQHHDIYPMQNGNILVIAWDLKTPAQALAEGRDSTHLGVSLWSEKILEIQPTGTNGANIVWQWNVWDHLVQSYDSTKQNYGNPMQHPELIHLNFFTGSATSTDWQHCNSIDYDETLDQIILSSHNFCEFWIIDHGTTTQEAATHSGGRYGKGGDLLYRWGNPQTYGRGTVADKKLFGQHYPHRIKSGLKDAGSVMVFNNGTGRPGGSYSSVDLIGLPMDSTGSFAVPASGAFLPDSAYWNYKDPVPANFYAMNISGAQRLENGNTLICSGPKGNFFEVDSMKNLVWKYVCPTGQGGTLLSQGTIATSNSVFRCTEYPPNYAGLAGHTLVPGDPIELNPLSYSCNMLLGAEEPIETGTSTLALLNYGDHRYALKWSGAPANIEIRLIDLNGRGIGSLQSAAFTDDLPVEIPLPESMADGIYVLMATDGQHQWSFRIVK